MEIQLSPDKSTVLNNGDEFAAVCHFCNIYGSLPKVSGAYNKPKKWAVVFGGTKRNPKRFFICEKCAKSLVTR